MQAILIYRYWIHLTPVKKPTTKSDMNVWEDVARKGPLVTACGGTNEYSHCGISLESFQKKYFKKRPKYLAFYS